MRVVVWGRMAEICSEYLKKGRAVFVEGRLQSRSWDGADGQKRNTLEVIAVNVQFLGAAQGAGSGAGKGRDMGDIPSGKEEIPDIQLEESSEMGGMGGKAEEEAPF